MRIGTHVLRNNVFVAPMAGVTDRPFRKLAKRFGAGFAVSEMTAANPRLRATTKSRRRRDHAGEPEPVAVQIAGADPVAMAAAARASVDEGAQIVDVNMGCPAKKVCNLAAGSALLRDEPLVARILDAVVQAVEVPVTLKFRTGWDPEHRNALRIAALAEQSGVRMLALHGRTRACGFAGPVEYDTIRAVKAATRLPVVANGDIATPHQARAVLEATGADGVMVGRAALGRPWLFGAIAHFLATGRELPAPRADAIRAVLVEHLQELYVFYGRETGLKVARKHAAWYTHGLPSADALRRTFNGLETCEAQLATVDRYFEDLAQQQQRSRCDEKEELAA
jgi:tRNA-dihydrouridine synthase B